MRSSTSMGRAEAAKQLLFEINGQKGSDRFYTLTSNAVAGEFELVDRVDDSPILDPAAPLKLATATTMLSSHRRLLSTAARTASATMFRESARGIVMVDVVHTSLQPLVFSCRCSRCSERGSYSRKLSRKEGEGDQAHNIISMWPA